MAPARVIIKRSGVKTAKFTGLTFLITDSQTASCNLGAAIRAVSLRDATRASVICFIGATDRRLVLREHSPWKSKWILRDSQS